MVTMKAEARAAVFLDRDGTLIHDRGYLRTPDEVVFYRDTVPFLKKLQEVFELFIVTNQSGISKGLQTESEVREVNGFIEDWLKEQGVRLRMVYTCPHQRSDGCGCIKPNPTFALEASADFGLDLARSFAVGDHPHDVEFGRNFGGDGLYLLTGHGEKHRSELQGAHRIFDGIKEAAEWMMSQHGSVS